MSDPDLPVPADWLPIDTACRAYGISLRTMRRRLAAGQMEARRVRTSKGQEWRIKPPGRPPDTARQASDTPPAVSDPPPVALLALADVERLLAPVVQERDRLAAQVENLQQDRITDARQIGELTGRLAAQEAELARLRAIADDPPRPRWRWPWQR